MNPACIVYFYALVVDVHKVMTDGFIYVCLYIANTTKIPINLCIQATCQKYITYWLSVIGTMKQIACLLEFTCFLVDYISKYFLQII